MNLEKIVLSVSVGMSVCFFCYAQFYFIFFLQNNEQHKRREKKSVTWKVKSNMNETAFKSLVHKRYKKMGCILDRRTDSESKNTCKESFDVKFQHNIRLFFDAVALTFGWNVFLAARDSLQYFHRALIHPNQSYSKFILLHLQAVLLLMYIIIYEQNAPNEKQIQKSSEILLFFPFVRKFVFLHFGLFVCFEFLGSSSRTCFEHSKLLKLQNSMLLHTFCVAICVDKGNLWLKKQMLYTIFWMLSNWTETKCDRNVHKEFLCQKLPIFRILSRSKPFIESAKCLSILNILIYLVYRLNTSREEREKEI